MTKRYLGDGVYGEEYGLDIVLTTEDGISATNTIYLEPATIKALLKFLKKEEEEEKNG